MATWHAYPTNDNGDTCKNLLQIIWSLVWIYFCLIWLHAFVLIFIGDSEFVKSAKLDLIWERVEWMATVSSPFTALMGYERKCGLVVKLIDAFLFLVTCPAKIVLIYSAECLPICVCTAVLQLMAHYCSKISPEIDFDTKELTILEDVRCTLNEGDCVVT